MARTYAFLLISGIFVLSAGCRTMDNRRPFCCHKNAPPPKTVYVPPGQPVPLPPAPPPGTTLLPPTAGATFGPPSGAFPMVPPPPGPSSVPPPPPFDSKSRFEPNWKPTDSREPRADPRIQLYAPESIEKDKPQPTEEPPAVKKPIVQGTLSPIPRFGSAKANVHGGLHPKDAGFDWLRDKGVKTIVQIRLFGEDDSQDRKDAEVRGMRYVAFEVSPLVLTKEKADEFIKLIREASNPGVFVYDADGSLAGGMWYLYLRLGESFDDDASQLRARSLGLDLMRDGQHRDMWLAVQKLLSEN